MKSALRTPHTRLKVESPLYDEPAVSARLYHLQYILCGLVLLLHSGLAAAQISIGSWQSVGTLPLGGQGLEAPGVTVVGDYLYVAGGDTHSASGKVDLVYSYPIDASGNLGSVQILEPLPEGRARHVLLGANGRLLVVGGNTPYETSTTTVYCATVSVSPGTVEAWYSGPELPEPLETFGAVTSREGFVHTFGGGTSSVYGAVFDMFGGLFPWQSEPALSRTLVRTGCAAAGRDVFVTGGYNLTSMFHEMTIQTVQVGIDGGLSSWSEIGSLPSGRSGHGVVATQGYLFAMGGYNPSQGGDLADVSAAPLLDGALGSWTTLTSLPSGLRNFGIAAYRGYIYVVGGMPGPAPGGASYDILRAKINIPAIAASILFPATGDVVDGSRVPVFAGIENWSEEGVSDVLFQYRRWPTGIWQDIPGPGNPDSSFPYMVHWDVSELAEGEYNLRAIATNIHGVMGTATDITTVQVDHTGSGMGPLRRILGSESESGETILCVEVMETVDNTIFAADAFGPAALRITIPASALSADGELHITFRDAADFGSSFGRLHLGIDEYFSLNFVGTVVKPAESVTVKTLYPDAMDAFPPDGFVDGTTVREGRMATHHLGPLGWEALGDSVVNLHTNDSVASASQFSTFGLGVTNGTVWPASASAMNVSWTGSGGINVAGFTVERSLFSGGPYSLIRSVTPSITQILDTPLDCGTRYYYMVYEHDSIGNKAGLTMPAYNSTLACTPTSTPSVPTATSTVPPSTPTVTPTLRSGIRVKGWRVYL